MPEFRAYIVGRNGDFDDFVHLKCANQEQAKQYARALADGRAVELWQLDRKIERFEARE